jgi:hypothetical protein
MGGFLSAFLIFWMVRNFLETSVVDPYSFFPDPDPDPEFDVGD